MPKFEYLEHTADVLYRAHGSTLEECFENACLALNDTFAELGLVKAEKKACVECGAENEEKLLHTFLEQVLFEMQTRGMAFVKVKVSVKGNKCRAVLEGGSALGKTKTDVKAVTWNSFSLKKKGKEWVCTVLLDV